MLQVVVAAVGGAGLKIHRRGVCGRLRQPRGIRELGGVMKVVRAKPGADLGELQQGQRDGQLVPGTVQHHALCKQD